MNEWDLAIIGGGPAALSAAIYSSRYGLKTLIIEKQIIGGQVATTDLVENYPGFDKGISGWNLTKSMENQARRFGAEIKLGTVTSIESDDSKVTIHSDYGDITAKTALIATGSSYRKIGLQGEDMFAHYCATCDGAFYKDKPIITVGGGNAGVQEAMFLSAICSHVTMLVRSYVKADQILVENLKKHIDAGKITLLEGWKPKEIIADDEQFSGIKALATDGSNEEKIIKAEGLFVFAGQIPNTDFAHNIELDSQGYVLTDSDQKTSLPRVWVAGDVVAGSDRQIITAAASGARAAIKINHFLTNV